MFKKHSLIDEFLGFPEKIQQMKVHQKYFKKLFDQYDKIDFEICQIESGTNSTTEEVFNQMKITRLRLKIELYQFLKSIQVIESP